MSCAPPVRAQRKGLRVDLHTSDIQTPSRLQLVNDAGFQTCSSSFSAQTAARYCRLRAERFKRLLAILVAIAKTSPKSFQAPHHVCCRRCWILDHALSKHHRAISGLLIRAVRAIYIIRRLGDTTLTSTSPRAGRLFRDEHYDRRERIIKISRDITALSKKLIFHLHRVTQRNPKAILAEAKPKLEELEGLFDRLKEDLQGERYWRYQRSISPGIQEYVCYLY